MIEAAFPNEVAEICRHCLSNPESQRGYFEWIDRSSVLDFAIDVLGEYGVVNDLGLLRKWSRDAKVGKSAIRAIAKLEEVQVTVTTAS